jgi:hypothetical protein
MQAYKEAKTPASRGKVISHLEISEGEEGGHVVRHHYAEDGMSYHKPKEYTFGKDEGSDLMDHLKRHMHIDADSKPKQEDRERESETEGEEE